MPDGSLRPLGPPPSSTSHISTIDTSSSSSLRSFPLAVRKVRPKTAVDDSMKPKIFGSAPASPTSARPKTGHQSVRGRISGPFPIPGPLEDDEFPIRNPGTAIASSTPLDSSDMRPPPTIPPALPSPVAVSFAAPPPPPPPVSQTLTESAMLEMVDVPQIPQTVPEHPGTPTRPPGSTTGLPSGPSPESAVSNVSGTQSSAKLHRANPSSSARYSMMSAHSEAGGSTESQNGPPQRKRSTLRSAIGRLLRRKKKEGSLSSVNESERQVALDGRQQRQQVPQQQHRSVPPAMRAIPDQDLQPGKRVTSMPISEFDRALRSHSIGPDDITAIESARNSIDALGSSMSRLRAVTGIQDRIIIPRSRGEDWEGLSPRPASTHARSTDDDPNAIGRAITSDANGDSTYKRRSRSLSQLDQILPGDGRRRSDEIRYWRQSYDVSVGPLSPLSSNPSGPNDGEAEHNENHDGRRSMGAADSSAERVPPTPPQPFVFASTGAMNEMAGMKITQAATLDERFSYLETRMSKLERIVDQLCHSVPGFKGPLEVTASQGQGGRKRSGSSASAKAGVPTHHVMVSQPRFAYSNAVPPLIPAIYQTGSTNDDPRTSSRYTTSRRSVETTTDDNASSRMSFVDGHHYMDSLHPPSSSATHGAVSTVATSVQPPMPGLLRPASEVTVRPAASMPSLGSVTPNGEERSSNSAALLAQLDSERAARQLLEDQVRKLSERMNNLSTTMFAMVRDPVKSKSQERLRPQTANSGRSSTHLAPISVNTPGKSAIAPSSKAQSIFGKDMAGLGIASLPGSPSKEISDDTFSESFQTPREEMTPSHVEPFGDEFGAAAGYVGGVGDEGDDEMKRAARTLSLSQLTMGKMI